MGVFAPVILKVSSLLSQEQALGSMSILSFSVTLAEKQSPQ